MAENGIAPVVLCILDGWGSGESRLGNAVLQGNTPFLDKIGEEFPHILINASSGYVGLPEGQMGNSEVGHLNIGAGRVVFQDLPKITKAIENRTFFENKVIDEGMRKALEGDSSYHLFGLVSDGGVHSDINHIKAFLEKAKQVGLKNLFIHALMDGRDTSPTSGIGYMRKLIKMTEDVGVGQVATVSGRYWAMDRDNRWERVEKGFNAVVHGKAEPTAKEPLTAILQSYENGVTDEFIEPIVIVDDNGEPLARMKDGDVVQIFNFRADRVRQVTRALTESCFDEIDRGDLPKVLVYCLTKYASSFELPVAFETESPKNTLGEIVSNLGISQFRTAETEKYAHVTYFFNGGREEPFKGEERVLIESPKVATYDLQPEMSAGEVTDTVVGAVKSGLHRLIVVNFANGDMVGHTAVFEAALKAVAVVDLCVAKVAKAVKAVGGSIVITADHGNIEKMLTKDDKPLTSHTTNLVPFYLLGHEAKLNHNGGALCDVAPTLLEIMKINKPDEMTGKSLIIS